MVAKYLNLGCGSRYVSSDDWLNTDFTVHTPGIFAIDLRKKLPFQENTFDLIYHSHVLEHLTRIDAENFLGECYRILKPNGILRIVVPDLENIVREYMQILDEIRAGMGTAPGKYDWIMLELYDQVARQTPGGMMLKYLQQPEIPGYHYVLGRGGKEVQEIIHRAQDSYSVKESPSKKFNSQWHRLRYYLYWKPKQFIRHLPSYLKGLPSVVREKSIAMLLSQEYDLLKISRFRNCGEIHQWMYDSYSLEQSLQSIGFTEIQVQSPHTSYLNNWHQFNLDTESDGSIYKPNSLYMEGKKRSGNSYSNPI
ncbi:type 11 methyltransferase [Gloeomargarita lithophora Alchichica-D10]|uniref:Type 11 methyltransferase n=1 Tax=Gloeomargarita lithophora Alchichica-D10 TaxID=1188229 RepID=A0A1J0AF81_9CYAN|nr:methyltransferase domain-containing protein [Gloeomargarita lithophora]APB34598.1 type 11 methyltransferase [Gloeomargarita lithophora Alchichica-D10]